MPTTIDAAVIRYDGDASGAENAAKQTVDALKTVDTASDNTEAALQDLATQTNRTEDELKSLASEADKTADTLDDTSKSAEMVSQAFVTTDGTVGVLTKNLGSARESSAKLAGALGSIGGAASAAGGVFKNELISQIGGAIGAAGQLAGAFAAGGPLGLAITAVSIGVGGVTSLLKELDNQANATAVGIERGLAAQAIRSGKQLDIFKARADSAQASVRALGKTAVQVALEQAKADRAAAAASAARNNQEQISATAAIGRSLQAIDALNAVAAAQAAVIPRNAGPAQQLALQDLQRTRETLKGLRENLKLRQENQKIALQGLQAQSKNLVQLDREIANLEKLQQAENKVSQTRSTRAQITSDAGGDFERVAKELEKQSQEQDKLAKQAEKERQAREKALAASKAMSAEAKSLRIVERDTAKAKATQAAEAERQRQELEASERVLNELAIRAQQVSDGFAQLPGAITSTLDAFTSVGGDIFSGLIGDNAALSGILGGLGTGVSAGGAVAGGIGDAGAALANITGLETLGPLFENLGSAVGIVTGGLAGFFDVLFNLLQLTPGFEEFVALVSTLAAPIIARLAPLFELLTPFVGVFLQLLDPFITLLLTVVEQTPLLQTLFTGISLFGAGLLAAVGAVSTLSATYFDAIFALQEFINGLNVPFLDNIDLISAEAGDGFREAAADAFANSGDLFGQAFTDLNENIIDLPEDQTQQCTDELTDAIEANTAATRELGQSITNLPTIFNLNAARASFSVSEFGQEQERQSLLQNGRGLESGSATVIP